MISKIKYILVGIIFFSNTYAEDFDNQRYQNLIEEIRCMVCQNQNIAESEAPLAVDLREKVKEMLLDGKSNIYIKNYREHIEQISFTVAPLGLVTLVFFILAGSSPRLFLLLQSQYIIPR